MDEALLLVRLALYHLVNMVDQHRLEYRHVEKLIGNIDVLHIIDIKLRPRLGHRILVHVCFSKFLARYQMENSSSIARLSNRGKIKPL